MASCLAVESQRSSSVLSVSASCSGRLASKPNSSPKERKASSCCPDEASLSNNGPIRRSYLPIWSFCTRISLLNISSNLAWKAFFGSCCFAADCVVAGLGKQRTCRIRDLACEYCFAAASRSPSISYVCPIWILYQPASLRSATTTLSTIFPRACLARLGAPVPHLRCELCFRQRGLREKFVILSRLSSLVLCEFETPNRIRVIRQPTRIALKHLLRQLGIIPYVFNTKLCNQRFSEKELLPKQFR